MKIILSFALIFFYSFVFAQPDLVCSNITNTQSSLAFGQQFSCSFKIKNIGSNTAAISHASISLVDSATLASTYLADVSTESLAANTETGSYDFILPLPYSTTVGHSYILIQANSRGEVSESNTTNNATYSTNTIKILNRVNGGQNLPYPVILIHGLMGNDTTWYPFLRDAESYYGYNYGGNMNFCLNQDGNVTKSYLPTDFKDWTDTTKLAAGDFYTINFDVDTLGNKYSASTQSNQSAAIKQGVAIKKAIEHVLEVTKKDKVILVGHSMGGLAAREYLQNKTNWQPDGKHHVAKLYTLGTPHGGSNSTSGNLTSIFNDVDERSEAVRDLRRIYDISLDSGVYLYGGTESLTVMNNSLIENYFNADVNCNGVTGNKIVGLNHKSIPIDLAYTCVIGNDTYFPGLCSNCDGVVNFIDADLNNFLPQVKADTFFCVGEGSALLFGGKPWHVELPKQTNYNIIGLDEPDNKQFAYQVDFGKHYFGHFTKKNAISFSAVDSDYYKFTVPSDGSLTAFLDNISTTQASIRIYDSVTNTVKLLYNSNGKGYFGRVITLTAGTYYMNIYSQADTYSWEFPYAFKLTFTPNSLPIMDVSFTATAINKAIQTNWYTSTELNTDHFIVQHSTDGTSFTDIGTIKAVGSGANGYSFTDTHPTNGTNYYRLQSLDRDGASSFSKVVSAEIVDNRYEIVVVPNPVKSVATIKGNHIALVQVIDNIGRVVKTVTLKDATNPVLSVNGLPAGMYHLRIQTTDGNVSGVGMVKE